MFKELFKNDRKSDVTSPQMSAVDATEFNDSLGNTRICTNYWGFLKGGWEAWTRTRISRSRICCTANCTTSQHGELRRSAEGITNVAPRQPLPARFERPAQS